MSNRRNRIDTPAPKGTWHIGESVLKGSDSLLPATGRKQESTYGATTEVVERSNDRETLASASRLPAACLAVEGFPQKPMPGVIPAWLAPIGSESAQFGTVEGVD